MGRSVSQIVAATGKVIGTFVAGESLVPGDVGVLMESGVVRKRIPSMPISKENNITAGPVVGIPWGPVMDGLGSVGGYADKLAMLDNGNVAFAAFSSSNYPVMWVANAITGGIVGAKTVIALNSIASDVQVIKLNASSFAVLWDSGTNVYMATFSNNGVPMLAPTLLCAMPAGNLAAFGGAVMLANGEMLLTIRAEGKNVIGYRFSTSGVLLGTTPTIVTLTTATSGYAIPLAAGGFLYAYFGETRVGMYLQKYDAAGAKVGATVTISSAQMPPDQMVMRKKPKVIELVGGNIATTRVDSATPGVFVTTLSANLKPLNSDVLVATDSQDYVNCLCRVNDGFAVVSNASIANFNSEGVLKSTFGYNNSVGYRPISAVKFFYNGANLVFGYWGTDSDVSVLGVDIFSSSGVRVGAGLSVLPAQSLSATSGSLDIDPATQQLIFGMRVAAGNSFRFGSCLTLRSSIVGVVQSAAVPGGDVQIGTAGAFTLNANEINLGSFDMTTAAVPGTRGIIAGKSAYLLAIK